MRALLVAAVLVLAAGCSSSGEGPAGEGPAGEGGAPSTVPTASSPASATPTTATREELAQAAERSLRGELGPFPTVSCAGEPDPVPVEAGQSVECEVTRSDTGEKSPATVTLADVSAGRYTVQVEVG